MAVKSTRRMVASTAGHFETLARTLTRDTGMQVIPTAGECCTDCKTFIKVPILAEHLPKRASEILDGMLDHESGHGRCCKLDEELGRVPLHRLWEVYGKPSDKVHGAMNAVIDARDEEKMERLYPGTAENFQRSFEFCAGRRRELDPVAASDPKRLLFDVLCVVNARLRRKDGSAWGSMANQVVDEVLEEEVEDGRELVDDFAEPAAFLDLARRILEKLEAATEEPEPGEGDGEGGEGDGENEEGEGSGGKGDEEGDDEGGGSSGSSGDGDKDAGSSPGDENEDEGDGSEDDSSNGSDSEDGAPTSPESGDGGSADSSGADDDPEPGKAGDSPDSPDESDGKAEQCEAGLPEGTREELEKTLDSKLGDDPDPVKEFEREELEREAKRVKPKMDGIHIPDPKAKAADRVLDAQTQGSPEVGFRTYNEARNRARREIGALRAKLYRALCSKRAKRLRVEQEDGPRLHEASLHKLVSSRHDTRVFRKTLPGIEVETAVSILVDQSGSMSGSGKIGKARIATTALAETLNSLGIPFEVLGWWTNDLGRPKVTGEERDWHTRFNRCYPQVYYVYKAFNEPFGKVQKSRIGVMDAHNQNCDSEAVAWAADRLATRRERRKILIVMSDGQPCSPGTDSAVDGGNIRKVVNRCFDMGLEVIGLGILTDAPAYYYPVSVVLHDISDLATKLVKILEALLHKGKRLAKVGTGKVV